MFGKTMLFHKLLYFFSFFIQFIVKRWSFHSSRKRPSLLYRLQDLLKFCLFSGHLFPWWTIMASGKGSSRQPLRQYFMAFEVAPGIDLTETVDPIQPLAFCMFYYRIFKYQRLFSRRIIGPWIFIVFLVHFVYFRI